MTWPLGERPRDFYGPDDYDDTEPWQVTEARIKQAQADWDRRAESLTFGQRFMWALGFDVFPKEPK